MGGSAAVFSTFSFYLCFSLSSKMSELGKDRDRGNAWYRTLDHFRYTDIREAAFGDRGDARTPPKMSTGSSHPVANWHGGVFRDFSRVGGAAFHARLTHYLGPLLTAVGQRQDRASDPAALQKRPPSTVSLKDQNRPKATQLTVYYTQWHW